MQIVSIAEIQILAQIKGQGKTRELLNVKGYGDRPDCSIVGQGSPTTSLSLSMLADREDEGYCGVTYDQSTGNEKPNHDV